MADLIGFLALLPLGLWRPKLLLYLFIWTLPFIGGNAIGPLIATYSPSRSLGFCYVFCIFLKSREFSHAKALATLSYGMLSLFAISTILGARSAAKAPYVYAWIQSPWIHGSRVFTSEVLIWILPVAVLWQARQTGEATKILRHTIWAGVFYCFLGLLQLGVARATGYDLFPIVRGQQGASELGLQSVAQFDGSGAGRINSVCGEPRYLSLYCTIWLFLALLSADKVGFKTHKKAGLIILFLLTNILTASRSGLAVLALGSVALTACSLLAVQSNAAKLFRKTVVLLFGILILGSFWKTDLLDMYAQSSLSKRVSYKRQGMNLWELPLEYQDSATVIALAENMSKIPFGFGAGLWQYYVDPFEDVDLVRGFSSVTAFDSMKNNIGIIARISNFGLFGLSLIVIFYRTLYVSIKSSGLLRFDQGNLLFELSFWVIIAQLTTSGESYAIIIALACAFLQPRRKEGLKLLTSSTRHQTIEVFA